MDSVVADWFRIGICSAAFILVLKFLFTKFNVPGLSPIVASI